MADLVPALSAGEKRLLAELEDVIGEHLRTFVEVGLALVKIRNAKLYRVGHKTFEDYLESRWGFHRAHAYRLIDGAEVATRLSPTGRQTPLVERQVRPLVGLDPQLAATVWAGAVEAAGGRQPTGKQVQQIAAQALAGLTAAQQRAVIEGEERRLISQGQARRAQEAADARTQRIGRCVSRARQLRRLIEGLGGEADEGVQLLDQLDAWLSSLTGG